MEHDDGWKEVAPSLMVESTQGHAAQGSSSGRGKRTGKSGLAEAKAASSLARHPTVEEVVKMKSLIVCWS